tara:strand:- start:103010 stop:103183 length:174 start_codon:yes stop_codon:yes gene_type:complete
MGRELKMKNLKLKIFPHSLSLRVNTRSLKIVARFSKFLDVSHTFDMTIQEFLIREEQ